MRRPRLLPLTLGLGPVLGLALGACSGAPLDSGGSDRPAVTPAAATLHRLTRAQYQESARTLLGDWIQVPQDLEVDTALQGYASVGASALTISPQAAEQSTSRKPIG